MFNPLSSQAEGPTVAFIRNNPQALAGSEWERYEDMRDAQYELGDDEALEDWTSWMADYEAWEAEQVA